MRIKFSEKRLLGSVAACLAGLLILSYSLFLEQPGSIVQKGMVVDALGIGLLFIAYRLFRKAAVKVSTDQP